MNQIMPSKSPRPQNMSKESKIVTMKQLREEGRYCGLKGWRTMSREDLEFWIREWNRIRPRKDLDKPDTTVTALKSARLHTEG